MCEDFLAETRNERNSVLKIGEFARVAQVSIATLRHYEKVGLLKPAVLDPDTSYRYYSLDQLPRVHRLLALKDLGFSLEQIAQLLEGDLSLEHLRGMFTLKQAQTQQMIDTEQARQARIAVRICHIEQEGKMPTYEVLLKQVDAVLIASLREIVRLDRGLGQSYGKVAAYLERQGVQPGSPALFLLHSRSQQRDDGLFIDLETAIPLAAPLSSNEQVSIRMLAGGLMACTIHTGADLFLGQAYAALYRWMKDNHYQPISPAHQVRLRYDEQMAPTDYVTEVQFPVEQQT